MTSYEVIYGRFLNSITDFNLAELDDHTLNTYCYCKDKDIYQNN